MWSDTTEDRLSEQVHSIVACLAPEGANVSVLLCPSLHAPSPWCSAHLYGKDFCSQREQLINGILGWLNVSAFRGLAPSIQLLEERAISAHERTSSIPVFLDILDECGLDASAAADAMARSDFTGLLQIVSSEAYEEARREMARVADSDESLVRHGFEKNELPF
jgi:hypothetical protein